ncbi:tyrosine-type recombinase/integrase [Dechloromonas sp. A34]|uniref:tyrosine-type recombinase/integrase n=1 Tax=Dechloromonas sp. A34 TaxID=447588 RepID=UPI0022499261|nr:hypothetical protein [Dechloromonas sp. A34]
MVILNAMFSWLVNAGYLAGNPLSLSRQRSRRAKPRVTRFLDDDLWQAVKATIAAPPRETDREREHYGRARWVFSLPYGCGLRISEMADNTMGGFFCRKDARCEDRWWLEVVGKGDKIRIIPVTNELLAELIHYRRGYGLAPLPLPGDTMPLVLTIAGKPKPLTRSALHGIIKRVFGRPNGWPCGARIWRTRSSTCAAPRHTGCGTLAAAHGRLPHGRCPDGPPPCAG